MAHVTLLGEAVKKTRKVDERTAFAIDEILEERDYQDLKWSDPPLGATPSQIWDVMIVNDAKKSGSDWNALIDQYQQNVKPDMNDPETRKAFIKIAALALAALRAS